MNNEVDFLLRSNLVLFHYETEGRNTYTIFVAKSLRLTSSVV
jgi:hypothetical protein